MDELINAIAAVIASKYPHIIYIDSIGEGFKRPAFFLYRISDLDTTMNRWTYNTNAIIQIVYFSPLDDYHNIIDNADQTSTMQVLKHTFMSTMAIKFGNDWAKIKQINIDYTGDKDIFLQLNLDTTIGTREEYEESKNTQLMGEINFKI